MARKDNPIAAEAADSLAALLRQARQARGIPLGDLALKLGYTKGYLSTVENGWKHPARQLVLLYASFLGADESRLLAAWRREDPASENQELDDSPTMHAPESIVSLVATNAEHDQPTVRFPVLHPEQPLITHVAHSKALVEDDNDPENDVIAMFISMAQQDPAPEVRIEALLALAELGPEAIIPALMHCLKDADSTVRRTAIQAIKQIMQRDDVARDDPLAFDEQDVPQNPYVKELSGILSQHGASLNDLRNLFPEGQRFDLDEVLRDAAGAQNGAFLQQETLQIIAGHYAFAKDELTRLAAARRVLWSSEAAMHTSGASG